MHSFITILTVATAALTAALPHANVHYKLHPVRRDLAAGRLTLAGRDVPTTYNLSPIGTCGSTTGYQCSPGMCCSQWGYCGTGPAYCGAAGGSNSTAPQGTGTGVPAYSAPASSASAASSPAPAASSAATSAVVSPVGKGPASAHHRRPHHKSSASSPAAAPSAYSPPAGAPSGYSSPAGAPSAYSSATATGAASAPPAYTSSAQSAPATSAGSTSAPAQGSATAAPTGTASAAPSSYSSPAPQSSSSPSSGGGSGANTYKMYNGDGSSSAGWPAESAWADFDSLWEANLPTIKISCAQFTQAENSDQENDDMKSAIQSVGSSSGVDPRFILAIIMQESKGCVRVDSTYGSVSNPGLMQSHDGKGTCYNAAAGQCSSADITQMISDGTEGTAYQGSNGGPGLKQLMSQCSSASGSQQYYEAARMYNSGSIAPGGDLGQGVATHCYAADIANRLTGWTTATCTCTLD